MAARKLSALIVVRGQASGVFQLSEEALDEIAVTIKEGAKREALLAIAFGGYVGEAASALLVAYRPG